MNDLDEELSLFALFANWQIPEKGRRAERQRRCDRSNKGKDISPTAKGVN